MDKPSDVGFIGRWSRLKRGEPLPEEVQEPSTPEQARVDAVPGEGAVSEVGVEPVASSVKVLTDEDMPDLEALDQDSDFSGFLSQGVSEGLRRKALKKLFHLPEFNLRDGLNEYDDDFTQFEPLGDTVTYQMKQWLERQKQDFQNALADEEPDNENDGQASRAAQPQTALSPDPEDDELGEADG
ncbi:DUF3306 domain-containing protein [Motiliproteus sp. SC1-56]|uniref:DUF3306 domain-containing protein n=1 Tax=Motiliproteus sp. SC1-56 TaxID=2799565 RepID=UPI001A8CB71D|nr:DUF3306 domain-containing protein [Motiliproteus sp. SC1-56]